MSRRWIIGIVSLTICSTTFTACHAQNERSDSSTVSLSDRFAAFRDKFRRSNDSTASQHKTTRNSQSSSGSHQKYKSSDSGSTRTAKRKPLLSSAGTSGLLPDFFGQKNTENFDFGHTNIEETASPIDEAPEAYDPADLVQEIISPRSDSISSRKYTKLKTPRRSPSTKRTNNLETALADLLPTDDVQADRSVAEDTNSDLTLRQPTTSRSRPTHAPSNSFDLHHALIGDKTSEAVVEDTEETTTDEEAIFARLPMAEEPIAVQAKPARTLPSPVATESRPAFIPRPAETTRATDEPVSPQNTSKTTGDLSLSYQQPTIVSHVKGPRSITVGREATYQITLENTSETSAKSLVAAIRVPSWAEVVDATSTSGVVERASLETKANALAWKLSQLSSKSSETLHLRLIPRSGQPLQLDIQWSQAPMASATMVEVQEPKLRINISGPEEVLFGKPQRYRLTLSNPGTGEAEQVAIQLIPPGGNAKSAVTQTIGTLGPGEVRDIDLELTARQAGKLSIQASATALGGLTAEAKSQILCLQPELQVDWRGPETKYAGTVAAYYFRVRNPGTASTEPVTVQVKLPEGAKFIGASEGHVCPTGNSNIVSWQLPSISAGQEQFLRVRCQVDQPGINVFHLTAQTANGDLSDTKDIETNVVALADLKLEVSDPQGPIPLGETVLYEIRVRNRGTTAAEGINVVGLFSAGIDPSSVEGAQYSMKDGRVTFHPITSLPAGREVVLRIRATASQAGTHVFRAEVVCQDLEIKLAAEETTRFYEDEFRWEEGKTPYSAERNNSVAR